ncbi:MAG: type II toxin-antitoxin system CcdA family antitoxin [Gemmatimonadales bacterium]
MKQRVSVTLDEGLLEAVDTLGDNRSRVIERLIAEALAARADGRWVRELATFYRTGRPANESAEDAAWHATANETLERDD